MTEIQTLRAADGSELVVLPRGDYERLLAAAEDRSDISASLNALRDIADGVAEAVPHAVVVRLIAGENPVRVWREHRGLTIVALAAAADLSQPFVSQIETGKREPTVRTLVALARVLGVDLDDLVVAEE